MCAIKATRLCGKYSDTLKIRFLQQQSSSRLTLNPATWRGKLDFLLTRSLSWVSSDHHTEVVTVTPQPLLSVSSPQLYICDDNRRANEYDFKKALDLLEYVDEVTHPVCSRFDRSSSWQLTVADFLCWCCRRTTWTSTRWSVRSSVKRWGETSKIHLSCSVKMKTENEKVINKWFHYWLWCFVSSSWSSADGSDDPLEAAKDSTFVKILLKLIQEGENQQSRRSHRNQNII